jgi:cell division transport system permease protein
VLGVFIPIVQATNGAANSVRSRVMVDVYMKTGATAADATRVQQELRQVPHVRSVQYVSKATAYAQQSKQDPQAYALLASNPLPDTFHLTPDKPGNVLAVRDALAPTSGKPLDPAIQSVSNKKSDTRKILEVTNLVTITAAVLTVLLTLASILLIANTIRLSLYARRREVEVMKLVGATDWFIRWPFVIEGVIVGAAGALLAIVVLGATKIALLDPLANNWTLIAAPRTIAFSALVAVMLGSGVIVSALGSGLSLRRFLRV